jgi:putative restriction endonuclease
MFSTFSWSISKTSLVGWHRGTFERVSSRDSIMRRVSYLQQVGFIEQDGEEWVLGEISDQQLDTHPELGWSQGEADMTLQRVNRLRRPVRHFYRRPQSSRQ